MGKSTGCMGWQLCALGQALICWDFRTSISLLLLLLFISAVIHSQKWWNSNSSSWPPLCISDVSSFGEGQLSKSGRRTGSICSVIYCSKLSLFYFIGLFCVLVLLLKSKSWKQSLWNLLKFTSLLLLMILRSESWTEKAESSRWAYFLILFSLFLLLLLASCHYDVWDVKAAMSWDWDMRCYQASIHRGLRREFWITSKFAASTPSPSPVATHFLFRHPHRDATRI